MRPIGTGLYRRPAPVIYIALVLSILVLYPGAAAASVGLSLRVNLWEVVPLDDPVFDNLRKRRSGVISYPEDAHEGLPNMFSSDLPGQQGGWSRVKGRAVLTDSAGAGLAGLRRNCEIKWVSWGYDGIRISDRKDP